MKRRRFCSSSFALLGVLWGLAAPTPGHAQAAKPVSAHPTNPFEEAAYLWTQAYDTSINGPAGQGRGDWMAYKSPLWLNVPSLGVESDPGWGPGDWYDCSQHVNWNAPWGQMQAKHPELKDVILGIGQMPGDPNTNDSWDQKLAWENQQWKAEAANDPALMAYFANYAKEVDSLGFTSVIIRLGYEFDGGWNPFGNLNVMSDMPGNYIKAWQNIVAAMRAADTKHIIRGFLWNPTDGNVQIDQFKYYPGDASVDFVGFDEYDFGYNGDYKVSKAQPTQAQQDAAWTDMELPRINRFADLARTHGKRVIVGEWGLWQLNDQWHPSGGDNPSYIRRMRDWMADPNNHVYMEVYFETPSDGDSQLWPGYSSSWGSKTAFPLAAAEYRRLFGGSAEEPRGGTAKTLPGTIVCADYDTGGPGVAYNAAPDAGGHGPAWTAPGQWLNYTVSIPTAGAYRVAFRVAATTGGTFHLQTPEGRLLTGPVRVAGGRTGQTVTVSAVLPAGRQTLQLSQDTGGCRISSMTFTGHGGDAPYGGTAKALPGTVPCADYNQGGPGVAYWYGAGGSNAYRPMDAVFVEPCADTGNGYDVGSTNKGQWTNYTVRVPAAGTYHVAFRVASGGSGGTFHLQTPAGTKLSGPITAPATGGWQTWQTVTADVSLPAGTQTVQLYQDTGGYNLNAMTFTGP